MRVRNEAVQHANPTETTKIRFSPSNGNIVVIRPKEGCDSRKRHGKPVSRSSSLGEILLAEQGRKKRNGVATGDSDATGRAEPPVPLFSASLFCCFAVPDSLCILGEIPPKHYNSEHIMSKLRSSLARLTVAGAAFYAYHGVKAEERDLGGKYEVDLDLYYDSKQAVISDNISDAVNYEEALYRVSEVINSDDHYELVETLAYDILRALMNRFPLLMEVTVRIRKYYAPVRHVIGHIEVEQTLVREDQVPAVREDMQ